jgi:hypothetical protein
MKTCIHAYFHNDALPEEPKLVFKQIDIWHHRHQSSLNMGKHIFTTGKIGIHRFSQN